MSNFNISIIDNFFNKDDFKFLIKHVSTLSWNPLENIYKGIKDAENKHFWYSSDINKEDKFSKNTLKLINKKTLKKFKGFKTLNFSLAHNPELFPHVDTYNNASFQFIIYIKGLIDINQGTGFYTFDDDKAVLNTHVGFYPNRLVMWNCGVYHAPLLWNSKKAQPRISMLGQIK